MKKLFTLFLALVATTALWAEDFSVDGIYYNILSGKINEVEVTYRGWSYDSYTNEYSGSVTIPETVTYNGTTYSVTGIGMSAFDGCSGLISITIPNSVTSIENYAFDDCSSLTSPVYNAHCFAYMPTSYSGAYAIPEGIKQIVGEAFRNCSSLTSVSIPNSVTSIGYQAFRNCSSLTSITIPEGVTSIGNYAFYECSGLPVENSLRYADTYLVEAVDKTLSTYSIKEGTKWIGSFAFRYCSGFTSITIPNSVTSIGGEAFAYCKGLTSITIPNSVTSIGDWAFWECTALTSVTIGNSVTSIGDQAFYECSSLTSVTSLAEVPPTLGSNAFYNVSTKILVYVPCGAVSAYQSAYGWRDFTNIQELLAEYSIVVDVNDSIMGTAKVDYNTYCKGAQISATANCGYHFVQWSDGNTDNPRVLVLTQDTTFTAEFAPNQYNITTTSSHAERGTTQGDTTVNYLEYTTISATANYGYHFTQWNDGNTDNPRTVQVTGDTTYTAQFDKNTYSITKLYDAEQGSITGSTSGKYLDVITLTATPNLGYVFVGWSDGVKDNPRSFVLTKDTTFTAEFAQTFSGQCGDNLYWAYDEDCKKISITGSGDMYDYTKSTQPWYLFQEQITEVTTSNTTSSIGTSAFSGCSGLTSVSIGNSVTSIGESAFRYCSSLTSITIPNSVTSIGNYAFSGCKSLTSVVWNAKNFADFSSSTYAPFNDIRSQITSFTFGESVEYIPAYLCYKMDNLTSITIPNSVKVIGDRAFSGCSSLTSVSIPNSVTSIGSFAFSSCSSLTSITIPNSVISIGYQAFRDCSSLTSITIPEGVTSIGSYAFFDCSSLTSVTSLAEVPPTLGYDPFYNVSTQIPVYVPCGTVSAYQSAEGWKAFTNIQELLAEYSIVVDVNDSIKGTAKVDYNTYCEGNQISATANYGYHFVQWSDGNTDNPRALVLTQDTTLTAEFAINQYNITTTSSHAERGTTKGDTTVNYLDQVTITATPVYGYHFVQWSDDNTDNPRAFVLTQDTTFTAEFAPNQYQLSLATNYSEMGSVQGAGTYDYLTEIEISATANYGYHFTQWNDGDTDNPRTVQVTKDTTYIAEFDKNIYTITTYWNDQMGSVDAPDSAEYLDEITISATANYGYHFVQWSDGNTDNPRSFVLTKDTTFTAFFTVNQYQLSTSSNNPEAGTVTGAGTYDYNTYAEISATANYGYHFSYWNDGNTDNPRVVQVTGDKAYTAYFNKNTYTVSVDYNSAYGTVTGPTSGVYMDELTLTATPNLGYVFVGWSDGVKDNPRTIVLNKDIHLTANFAQAYSGQCGDNLYWAYDEDCKKISITGSGDMYDYTKSTQPWLLFQEQITEVTTSNTTTSIGTSAFEGCIRLGKVSLGYGMGNIAANAFAECKRLYDVYVFASYPPFAEESSFANYNVYLYVPCENKRDYVLDVVWGEFKFIECIGAESNETGGDDVTVTPGSNDVTITWPTEDEADTYSIVITKDGEVFCTLTFNSNGQLVSIAFAPGREGNHPAQYAEAVANGYRFTVTGLDESTKYGYNLEVKDSANQTIQSYEGEFTTMSDVTTDMDNVTSTTNVQKLIRDGQLLIIRDGKTYNAQGAAL